jgi:hypothetical protein
MQKGFFLMLFFVCLSEQTVSAKNKLSGISDSQKAKSGFSDIYKSNDGYFWNLLSRQEKHSYLKGLFDGFTLLSKKVRTSKRCDFNTKKEVVFESYSLNHIKYNTFELSTILNEIYQNKKNLTIPISEFLTRIADENK